MELKIGDYVKWRSSSGIIIRGCILKFNKLEERYSEYEDDYTDIDYLRDSLTPWSGVALTERYIKISIDEYVKHVQINASDSNQPEPTTVQIKKIVKEYKKDIEVDQQIIFDILEIK